jgi:hypothetical protein
VPSWFSLLNRFWQKSYHENAKDKSLIKKLFQNQFASHFHLTIGWESHRENGKQNFIWFSNESFQLILTCEKVQIYVFKILINDKVLITVGCPIFPSILIAKYLFTGSLKNRSIDNLETQKKYISMKNSQFFNYLLYAKSK